MDGITITIDGKQTHAAPGVTLAELAAAAERPGKPPVLAAMVNNELTELWCPVTQDCGVSFLDLTNPNGFRVYQRSVVFLMLYAARQALGRDVRVVVQHSVQKNYYCEIEGITATEELLADILARMNDAARKNLPITKHVFSQEEGSRVAAENGMADKVSLLKYRRTANVNFYQIDGFYDYFYGAMAPDAGRLSGFGLMPEGRGFMLLFPSADKPNEPGGYKRLPKMTQVFMESARWARILGTDTVGALNDRVCGQAGGSSTPRGDVIRTCEALHEKRLGEIADRIAERGAKVALVAGPSSSGKTTFAERLCVQLRVNGLSPHVIGLDNYYVDRARTPLDEDGKPDFEALEAIDVETFNRDLLKLLSGAEVELPSFNFVTGTREYRGRRLRLRPTDVLVIEGIHGLNDKLTPAVPASDKFKIFISALTQLNIDDHNRIPTGDTRLIRRIVRDNQFRGFDARRTIEMWPSVTRGENKHIFPFQEEADAVFNSALIYEMSVLKLYAEPLLFRIERDAPERAEARRLVKFLDCFVGLPSDEVPNNSILREFIGGSCFRT